jgi:hypothetical protein
MGLEPLGLGPLIEANDRAEAASRMPLPPSLRAYRSAKPKPAYEEPTMA